ncbi:AAI domain-containing protein [Psidium guajava]|nr:AAI domain-containing protein [Psidium guajava]
MYKYVLCIVLMFLFVKLEPSAAVTCDPMELSSCASAISSSSPPSAMCCAKLKEQKPCLCQYMKNPNLQKLINSPNSRKVAIQCGSPFPSC